MERLLKACEAPDYPAAPKLVLSNRPGAAGLETAERLGIETLAIDHRTYGKDRERFERAMDEALQAAKIDIIALAGFMRILTPCFITQWAERMINIHPSLLPKYPGLDTYARAIAAGDNEAGCTVHWVNEVVDGGDIIDQARVPVLPDDTPETLAERVLVEEHKLYPRALAAACQQLMQRSGDGSPSA